MARSKKIYLVTFMKGDQVIPFVAFTVKHELQSWLNRNYDAIQETKIDTLAILAFPDGGHTMDLSSSTFGFEETVKDVSDDFTLDKPEDSDTVAK